MSASKETLATLKHLGLSDYEARAYSALVGLISGTATEISLSSQVPRSKIYDILRKLAEKGFIEITPGKPLRYTAISPHNVIGNARKQMEEKMSRAEAELEVIYENRISNVPAPIWLIHGSDKIINKEIEIIRRANNTIFIFGGFLLKGEIETLTPEIKEAIKRGVNIRILTRPQCTIDGDIIEIPKEILKQLKGLKCEVKITQMPYTKGIIRDDKEMMVIFCKLVGDNALSQTAIGIWNQFTEFTEMVRGVYNQIWNTKSFKE